jgi:putative endopeptidase
LKDDDRSKKIRKAYEEHVIAMFKLTGYTDMQAKQAFTDVMRMETAFAKASMSRVEMRDPEKRYNKMTLADLEKICQRIPWAEFFQNDKNNQPLLYREPAEFLERSPRNVGT